MRERESNSENEKHETERGGRERAKDRVSDRVKGVRERETEREEKTQIERDSNAPALRRSKRRRVAPLVHGIDFSMHRQTKRHKRTGSRHASENSSAESRARPPSHRPSKRRKNQPPLPPTKRYRQLRLDRFLGAPPPGPAPTDPPTQATPLDSISFEELADSWDHVHGSGTVRRDHAAVGQAGTQEEVAGPPAGSSCNFASLLPLIEGFHPSRPP